jgi:hypothetical protein
VSEPAANYGVSDGAATEVVATAQPQIHPKPRTIRLMVATTTAKLGEARKKWKKKRRQFPLLGNTCKKLRIVGTPSVKLHY